MPAARRMKANFVVLEENGSADFNPAAGREALEKEGISVKILDVRGSTELVLRRAGKLFGEEKQAERIIRERTERLAALDDVRKSIRKGQKAAIFLAIRSPVRHESYVFRISERSALSQLLTNTFAIENINVRPNAEERIPGIQELDDLSDLFEKNPDLIVYTGDAAACGQKTAEFIRKHPQFAECNAVKNGRKFVNQSDLFEAFELVAVGGKEKKDRVMSDKERKIVSYHEVGHALVSALQKNTEPVQKITIVPRTMGALGYVMQVPEEEKYLNTKSELEAMIVECLGGRAAEEIVFGNVTTGASNDIEKATKIVRAMITQYGMSEKFGLIGLATQQNQYLDGRMVLNCGDATATEIDHEVMKILKESYEQAKELLAANRDAMDEIAAYLIQKETITGKEFMEIFHQVIAKRNGNAEEAVENPEV